MEPTNQERRLRQMAVGLRDLPATTKAIAHAILLRQTAWGHPCTAAWGTLATDASVGVSTVREHVRRGREAGWLARARTNGRRSPDLDVRLWPTEAQERRIRRTWVAGAQPEPDRQRRWREGVSEAEGLPMLHGPVHGRLRFTWERQVRDTDRPTSAKGVAWALALGWNASGEPFGVTTYGDLADRSGYCTRTVKTRVQELEAGGWLWVQRRRGRGGGLVPWLRLPAPVLYRLRLRGDGP